MWRPLEPSVTLALLRSPQAAGKENRNPALRWSGRISCASFLAGENDDSSTQSSPGRAKHQPVKGRWKPSGSGLGRKIAQKRYCQQGCRASAMLRAVRMRSVARLSSLPPTATRLPEDYHVSADALRHIICHNH